MKRSGNFFLWIVLLAAGLLITITIAQIVTQNSLSRLREGNRQATSTFTMNNRLQEMVNLAFELETKLLTGKPDDLISSKRGIKDSLTRLEYNIGVLNKLWSDTIQGGALKKLVKFVDSEVATSFAMLSAIEKKNTAIQKLMSDSLRNSHWSDSIYSAAITFQKGIEQNLKGTLDQNNKAASQLSLLNRLLAGVALLAVLVLATIIIRRQVKQLSLIKDLQEARKVALQSMEAKDQFLANMSHEIRTPLNAIKGFGRILSQTILNTEQAKYTSIISTASENLLNIVNDILDFSKIETGNLVMKMKVFQLAQVVNEVGLMFSPLAQEKELQLFFSIDSAIPEFVKGDSERLRQILVNLLSNAIKFTSTGNVKLALQLTGDKENKVKTKFSVTDTGVGIPDEKIDIIFERFEQLDYSSTRQQGGTGLGLAITKKLVEAMGGRINVKSEVGKGSAFIVELDFEKINTVAADQEDLTPIQNIENVSLSNLKILVAEDNKMNQLLVKSILDKYEVITELVENGEEAIIAMKQNKYDLILMDVQMPKVDGITATKLFRANIDTTTPVIAMTAHVLPGEREKCIDAGMNDYLSKPLDEEEFVAMLKKYFSLRKSHTVSSNSIENDGLLNINYLNSICGNDQRKVLLITKELHKQLLLEIKAIEKIEDEKDKEELKRKCHHLKSTLSPLIASAAPVTVLAELSNILNQVNADNQAINDKCNQLLRELNRTTETIESILKNS
jgi:signal transduction histidine kinase/CheY-like chemotaxis protein